MVLKQEIISQRLKEMDIVPTFDHFNIPADDRFNPSLSQKVSEVRTKY
jgi:hypothetical protein